MYGRVCNANPAPEDGERDAQTRDPGTELSHAMLALATLKFGLHILTSNSDHQIPFNIVKTLELY